MRVQNNVVYFKSAPAMFEKENGGRKNNTVRILDAEEYEHTLRCNCTEIIIENSGTGELMHRYLTDRTTIGRLLGSYIVVFSWGDPPNGGNSDE